MNNNKQEEEEEKQSLIISSIDKKISEGSDESNPYSDGDQKNRLVC